MHDELFYTGDWTFHGPSVIAPSSFDEAGLVRDGPFAFDGSIFAYPTESRTGMPLFSANLRGGGTARVFFGVNTFGVSGPRLIAHDLHYMSRHSLYRSHPLSYWSAQGLVLHSADADDAHTYLPAQDQERAGTATQSSSDQSP